MNQEATKVVEELHINAQKIETGNASLLLIRRQTACFGKLLVILAEEQEKASARMEQQTDRLVKQTDRLVVFTKGLYLLTIALFVLAIVQLVVGFLHP